MRSPLNVFTLLLCLLAVRLSAQEVVVPLWGGPPHQQAPKQSEALTIPFFDDFSASNAVAPSAALWHTNGQTTVYNGYGLYPPTVGVAMLDAVDADGVLYQNITSPFPADTLLSAIVRLDSVFTPFAEALSPSDSLYLSFYYLPGGRLADHGGRIGDMPETHDSLALDFYIKASGTWRTVWSTPGCDPDDLYRETGTHWQHVMLPITDSSCFSDAFRFRFRNICSLDPTTTPGITANSDQWYLDCIHLDKDRSHSDNACRDVAFVHPARSLLKNYCAMPPRHYRNTEMATSTSTLITNLYTMPVASHYGYCVLDENGDTLHFYDGGYENVPPFPVSGLYQDNAFHSNPAVGFAFPANSGQTTYRIEHIVKEGGAGDPFPINDTTVFMQVFGDYFAYDDGTAENGYGLTSTSSNVFLACAFQLNEPDTLVKVQIYFNHTRNGENQGMAFRIAVWQASADGPGNCIYRDATLRHPAFAGLNTFVDYTLDQPLPLNGLVYIGLEQEGGDYINIGFDRNYNHSDRLYYRIGTEWQRASAAGSIMLRPCFAPSDGSLGIDTRRSHSRSHVTISPNPASDRFTVSGLPQNSTLTLFDMKGRPLAEFTNLQTTKLTLRGAYLPSGIYFLSIANPAVNQRLTKKVIISHD